MKKNMELLEARLNPSTPDDAERVGEEAFNINDRSPHLFWDLIRLSEVCCHNPRNSCVVILLSWFA